MTRLRMLHVTALVAGCLLAAAGASAQSGKSSHEYWPKIESGHLKKQNGSGGVTYEGTSKSDELLGHHGSDTISGGDGSDVLWGDWDPSNQPTTQHDVINGGAGTDFIYGSHGENTIDAGAGNDVISVHYGSGVVDCGPGRDIYHVARSRKKAYKFRNCEKVDYRGEGARGGPLKPLG